MTINREHRREKRLRTQKMRAKVQRHANYLGAHRLKNKARRFNAHEHIAPGPEGIEGEPSVVDVRAQIMGGVLAIQAARRKMLVERGKNVETTYAPGKYSTNKAGKLQRVGKAEEAE